MNVTKNIGEFFSPFSSAYFMLMVSGYYYKLPQENLFDAEDSFMPNESLFMVNALCGVI